MNASLRDFFTQYLAVCISTLALVAAIAFLSIPLSLGAHPGERMTIEALVAQHVF